MSDHDSEKILTPYSSSKIIKKIKKIETLVLRLFYALFVVFT